jgi:Tfp pilus assembly protein PilO
LSIGYIKPDIDLILTKKAEIATKDASIASMDSVLNNVVVLNQVLDKERGSEQFLLHYLPNTLDQDQMIDTFNYLASQAGLVITETELKIPPVIAVAPVSPDGTVIENPTPEVRTFVFTGSVVGTYENIKAFFDRFSHVGRFQKIQLFSIEKNMVENIGNKVETDTEGVLKGTFVAEYGYLTTHPGKSALTIPVFLQSQLDFSDIIALEESVTNIPMLEKGQVGKINPFE